MAAFMANGGSLGSQELMGQKGWNQLHEEPDDDIFEIMNTTTSFTKGGVNYFQKYSHERYHCKSKCSIEHKSNDDQMNLGREGFYGWFGVGGSVMQWNPELKIGFGYVPFEYNILDSCNARGRIL